MSTWKDFDRRLGMGGGGAGKKKEGRKKVPRGLGDQAVLGWKKCQSGGREGGVV